MSTIQHALRNALAFEARRKARRRFRPVVKRCSASIGHHVKDNVVAIRRGFGEILTPGELAAKLKVPESWVYEQRRSRCANKIPIIPGMGKYLRFDWDDVVAWLRRSAVDNESVIRPPRKTKQQLPRVKAS